MGWHHFELAGALGFVADAGEPVAHQLALTDRHSGADQRPHHAVAERVSLKARDEHTRVVAIPAEGLELPDRGRTLPWPAVRRPVVQPEQLVGGIRHALFVERGRVPERVAAQQRVALGTGIRDAVLVAAPDRREPRVEPRGCDAHARHVDVRPQPRDAVEPLGQHRRGLNRALAVRDSQVGELSRAEIEVRDLTGGVHPGVGAAGDRENRGLAVTTEDSGERGLELALHGSDAGLLRPAREPAAVVGDIEAQAGAILVARLVAHGCQV